MATQSQIARWVTVILSCVVVTIGGWMVLKVAPTTEASSAANDAQMQFGGLSSQRGAKAPMPIAMTADQLPRLPFDPMSPQPVDSHFARYDNIVVEVKPDGTLRVLGERMEMAAFKSLLVEQLREQLQTIVTIRPDGNCLFRHVGPVITVCEQAGVPHQTQSLPVPEQVSSPPDRSA